MSARIFLGKPGDLLGPGSDGVPVVGSRDGVELMAEITTFVSRVSLSNGEDDDAHDVTVDEAGHHRCLRCGAESVGTAPPLPCKAGFKARP